MLLATDYRVLEWFDLCDIGTVHPYNGMSGVLVRCIATRIYMMDVCGAGSYVSVPQKWAAGVAEKSSYIGAMF